MSFERDTREIEKGKEETKKELLTKATEQFARGDNGGYGYAYVAEIVPEGID